MWKTYTFLKSAPRIAVTVPHATCENETENRCDQVASKTWMEFSKSVGASVAIVGQVPRKVADLNRRRSFIEATQNDLLSDYIQGFDFVVDYHSSHVHNNWYTLTTPGQVPLVGRHVDAVIPEKQNLKGTSDNAIAEAAASLGIPCLLVEMTRGASVDEVARIVKQIIRLTLFEKARFKDTISFTHVLL